MDITNKTPNPLSVPLPGGKKLFLGPGKTGQVTAKALKHLPLVKLLESGDIETGNETPKTTVGRSDAKNGLSGASGTGHKRSGAMRQSGDR